MRFVQIFLFIISIFLFFIAAFFYMSILGLILWRAGIAILLLDVVCLLLWPTAQATKI